MYEHVLIATDGSDLSSKAVAQGLALAARLSARVTALTVSEPEGAVLPGDMGFATGVAFPAAERDRAATANAQAILTAVSDAAAAAGVPCETVHLKGRTPAAGILERAAARRCDLVVMASHGRRGLSRVLLGSQASQVLVSSQVPVLVIR